jgi:hypothetical protein
MAVSGRNIPPAATTAPAVIAAVNRLTKRMSPSVSFRPLQPYREAEQRPSPTITICKQSVVIGLR